MLNTYHVMPIYGFCYVFVYHSSSYVVIYFLDIKVLYIC
jgi:hypothetical protein